MQCELAKKKPSKPLNLLGFLLVGGAGFEPATPAV